MLVWGLISHSQNGPHLSCVPTCLSSQEIGYTHMKVVEGVNSLLQMAGLLARLCQKTMAPVAS